MSIRMTDLTQLATAFNERFEEKFKLYDQLSPPDSHYHTPGRLESVVSHANQQAQEFSKVTNVRLGLEALELYYL